MSPWLTAADFAEREAKTATPERLRELVGMLARELREIGDRHGKAGRPTMEFDWRRDWRLAMAKRGLNHAVIARCIVDGDKIGPATLARYMFFERLDLESESESTDLETLLDARADLFRREPKIAAEALDLLRPYAVATLEEMGLQPARVKRQGFRAEYRRRLIAEYRVVTGADEIRPPAAVAGRARERSRNQHRRPGSRCRAGETDGA